MVVDGVKSWRIVNTERWVSVLAMKAFLVTINHGLPVEVAFVFDAASIRSLREINPG